MNYYCKYKSIVGEIILISDGENLISLKINEKLSRDLIENQALDIFSKTINWLNDYFNGIEPKEKLAIKLNGTLFQKEVWDILLQIPYGKTRTYGNIAKEIALKRNINKMSAQAVGNAIHNNPIPIIVPCHRVVGNKNIGGYALGTYLKIKLLAIEKIMVL